MQRTCAFAAISFSWTWMIMSMIDSASLFFSSHIGLSVLKRKNRCAWVPAQKPNLGSLFSGDASRYITHELEQNQYTLAIEPDTDYFPCIDTVEIVVAYCNADLSWIGHAIEDIPLSLKLRLTILSKCGNENNITISSFDGNASNRFEKIDTIPLANAGGCDYAYIYYMNYILGVGNEGGSLSQASSILLFTKDTIRDYLHFHFPGHGYRSFGRMIEIASRGEFACGIYQKSGITWYHNTEILNKFILRKYTRVSATLGEDGNNAGKGSDLEDDEFNAYGYQSLMEFHSRALNYSFPQKYVPVCFGGSFAIPTKKLVDFASRKSPSGYGRELLQRIENSLARDSKPTAEEHFVERTWASIFSEPLTQDQIAQLETWFKCNHWEGQIELKHGFQF